MEMDVRDEDGLSPLHLAASQGDIEVTMVLLHIGVEVYPKNK